MTDEKKFRFRDSLLAYRLEQLARGLAIVVGGFSGAYVATMMFWH
jgi:hypothetical protein